MSDSTSTITRDTTPPPDVVQGNVGAIFQGMTDNVITRQQERRAAPQSPGGPLPDQLQPGYTPPQPTAIQPQQPATPATPGPQQSPAPWATASNRPMPQLPPPTQPQQVNLNQPYKLGAQPGPWPAAFPNSPVFKSANDYPPLPGETPQETYDLNRFAFRESPDGNVMNQWAAKDPKLYYEGHTDQGYWQDVNTTWADGAKRAGVDLNKYPTAMSADYWTQRKVNLALYRAYGERPWATSAGQGQRGDRFQLASTQMLAPQSRESDDWGHPPPMMDARMPGALPQQSEFGKIMRAAAPLLLAVASLALKLPLSSAINAYSSMARAQDNGEKEAYERSRHQWQDKLAESNAQQTLESQEASDAFAQYGHNNPQGLQQALMGLALKYNDPAMYQMAANGDLNGIHQMQAQRDLHNQSLTKLNKAVQEQKEQEATDAAVKALDNQWHDQFVKDHGREPTADEAAIQHNIDIGIAGRAGTKDPKGESAKEGEAVHNVLDKDGNPTGRQVRLGQDGGIYDLSGKPTTINEAAGEHLDTAGARGATGKPDTGDFTWTNPDGSPGKGYATYTPGKGLVDAQGNVIPQKPGTYPSKVSSQSMGSQPGGAGGTTGPIQDWDGMEGGDPPPDKGITPEAWTAAQQWAREGQAPKGLSSRAGGIYQQAWHALPYALHALGKTGADMPQDAIDYETRRVAATAAERNFASGQGFRQMVSLNTVAAHIDLFRQYATAMQNDDKPAMNRIANELAYQTGSPELTNMGIASIITGDEVIRLLTTTGGSRGDREDIKAQLNANSSPDQLMGAADALTNFVRERYEPLHLEYVNRLGAPDQTRKMYETEWQKKMVPAAKVMIQQGQRPIQGADPLQQPQQPQQPSSALPPRPANMPQGRTQYDKDSGHWRVDGKEYDASGKPL